VAYTKAAGRPAGGFRVGIRGLKIHSRSSRASFRSSGLGRHRVGYFSGRWLGPTIPTHPIRMVVTSAPGGAADVLARLLSAEMAQTLGQPVVIENRPGAAGTIAADFVAKAAPDGYTICSCTTALLTNIPLFTKVSYQPFKDLVPVVLTHRVTNLIAARRDFPADNIDGLIAYAKANPSKVTFGTAGAGGTYHLLGELFAKEAGISLVHVPYKGGSPAYIDLMGGQIDLVVGTLGTVDPLLRDGQIKALGVASPSRLKSYPSIPAIAETLPGFAIESSSGLFVPAGTPVAIRATDQFCSKPSPAERGFPRKDARGAGGTRRRHARGF
jgi:tripartite-type tricarboxylate transporter receptor subunit TctC